MPRCTRKGCGKEFSILENTDTSCTYHTGAPVFHEGLKSWSCCSTLNKPVLDFDEFMKIPGCGVGPHSEVSQQAVSQTPKHSATEKLTMTQSKGSEIYSTTAASTEVKVPVVATFPVATPAPVLEDEDDPAVPVALGTICKRKGCGVAFVSDKENRIGGGEGTVCTYHPAPPIFHEGSKGYLCCKKRVLEFEEFLKIEGCKKGRHLFAPKQETSEELAEQLVECRVDHYQTPKEVHVSVFAKQVDKEKSRVIVEETQVTFTDIVPRITAFRLRSPQVHFDLYLPAQKRFKRTIQLFGPVEPQGSSHKFYGTKVEVVLKKSDTRSWTLLEKTTHDLGNITLTFGVGGRTGTIGSKEMIVDEQNRDRV